jgi:hypothetical protein
LWNYFFPYIIVKVDLDIIGYDAGHVLKNIHIRGKDDAGLMSQRVKCP